MTFKSQFTASSEKARNRKIATKIAEIFLAVIAVRHEEGARDCLIPIPVCKIDSPSQLVVWVTQVLTLGGYYSR